MRLKIKMAISSIHTDGRVVRKFASLSGLPGRAILTSVTMTLIDAEKVTTLKSLKMLV